jgi:hypothetical protein
MRYVVKKSHTIFILLPVGLIIFYESFLLVGFRIFYKIYNPTDVTNYFMTVGFTSILFLFWIFDILNQEKK